MAAGSGVTPMETRPGVGGVKLTHYSGGAMESFGGEEDA